MWSSPDLQAALYARSPYNVVRVDLGLTDPGDSDRDNQYTRAAELLSGWKRVGCPGPRLAAHGHFCRRGLHRSRTGRWAGRHGVLAAMRLTEFGEGVVFPHERTLTGPKEDRFRLMSATTDEPEPGLLTLRPPRRRHHGRVEAEHSALSRRPRPRPTMQATSRACGPPPTRSFLRWSPSNWRIPDSWSRTDTTGTRPRFATRRLSERRRRRRLEPDAASDYCLVYLANRCDPALTIYPTHRLLQGPVGRDCCAATPVAVASVHGRALGG